MTRRIIRPSNGFGWINLYDAEVVFRFSKSPLDWGPRIRLWRLFLLARKALALSFREKQKVGCLSGESQEPQTDYICNQLNGANFEKHHLFLKNTFGKRIQVDIELENQPILVPSLVVSFCHLVDYFLSNLIHFSEGSGIQEKKHGSTTT